MSKALTHESHWRNRTGSHSTKASKRGVNLLGWECPENLTATEERDALMGRWKQIHALFSEGHVDEADRARLGQEMHRLQTRISQIRPKLGKLFSGIQSAVYEIMKERLTKVEFDALLGEARIRMQRDYERRAANEENK